MNEFRYYASSTGTKRNLDAIEAAGFGLMVTPYSRETPPAHFEIVGDCGAWHCHTHGIDFDYGAYERHLLRYGRRATWFVLPDKVAAGEESLAMSVRWLNRALAETPLVLIPVQDGMTHEDLEPLVGPRVGIFLGGSDAWKLSTAHGWGRFCARREVHFHFARVNTERRMLHAIAAGAASGDGSSASRYAKTVPLLAGAAAHQDLFDPRRRHGV